MHTPSTVLPTRIVSTTRLVSGEITDSVPSWRLATHTLPGSTATPDGPCPTSTDWRIVCVSVSTRETTSRYSSVTQTAPAPAAIAEGAPSSATWAVSETSSGSMTATPSALTDAGPGASSVFHVAASTPTS